MHLYLISHLKDCNNSNAITHRASGPLAINFDAIPNHASEKLHYPNKKH